MNLWMKTILAVACLLLAYQTASASVFDNLYQVRIEVSARDAATLEQAFRDAMAIILTRVTGTRQIEQSDGIEETLGRARDYIQQFGFIDSRTLLISFDGQAINRKLSELGQPVWGQERPATLIWLVLTDERGRRQILAAEDLGSVADLLKETASQRGVPIIIPLMDTEDQRAIDVSDLRGAFEENIFAASERYDADAILVGTARAGRRTDEDEPVYRVSWTLYFAGDRQSWRGNLTAGVDGAADEFARILAAIDIQNSGRQLVLVRGVGDLIAYGRVSQYLESLSLVNSVTVDRVHGDEVLFGLDLRADPDRLASAIKLGKILFLEDTDYSALSPGTMVYRYRQ
jgi:hypothetical protein